MAKKKKNPAAHHVRFYIWMLKSAAFRTLSVGARAALIEFYALYNGHNNGDLYMAIRELAKRLGVTEKPAALYRDELIDRGFIRVHVPGSFNQKTKVATTYILTEFPVNERPPTKDFASWRAPESPA